MKNEVTGDPWDIEELERFFQVVKLPAGPIKLNLVETIIDIPKFIDSHLSIINAKNGNTRYLPDLDRLNELKAVLTVNLN